MSPLPFLFHADRLDRSVAKWPDAFEVVRMDMQSEPKYYGGLHSDGMFIIRKHSTTDGDEHIVFYLGAPGETLATKWADRASVTYVEYDDVILE